jgi:diguanylate cyclase (GGDEF)-like protein
MNAQTEHLEQMAHLTGTRDRDLVDVTLVGVLVDLLAPRSATVYKLVGTGDEAYWFKRAELERGALAATSDPPWGDPDHFPRAATKPIHQRVLDRMAVERVALDDGHLTLFPVATETETNGLVEVRTVQPLGAEGERLVQSILRIYRNFQDLLDYSERDTLTGLLNRKSFDETFLKVTGMRAGLPLARSDAGGRRGAEQEQRYWIGVTDIDHFKRVNDEHGHLIGDEVLVLVARIMRNSFRHQDRLYRFGGEEFVVMLRCAGEEAAEMVFERFRANMAGFAFPQAGKVTVSIGFTEVYGGDTPAAAFERADKAVYRAKEAGRNRVCGYADLLRNGLVSAVRGAGDVELF